MNDLRTLGGVAQFTGVSVEYLDEHLTGDGLERIAALCAATADREAKDAERAAKRR